MYHYWDIWTCNFQMYCVFYLGGGIKKCWLFKIVIYFFPNVELDELITNQPTWNYPLCTVTEIFTLVTSKCIVFVIWGWGSNNFLFQNRNCFVSECRVIGVYHESPQFWYPSCIVTEIFGIVSCKCIVFFIWGLGWAQNNFLSNIEIICFRM